MSTSPGRPRKVASPAEVIDLLQLNPNPNPNLGKEEEDAPFRPSETYKKSSRRGTKQTEEDEPPFIEAPKETKKRAPSRTKKEKEKETDNHSVHSNSNSNSNGGASDSEKDRRSPVSLTLSVSVPAYPTATASSEVGGSDTASNAPAKRGRKPGKSPGGRKKNAESNNRNSNSSTDKSSDSNSNSSNNGISNGSIDYNGGAALSPAYNVNLISANSPTTPTTTPTTTQAAVSAGSLRRNKSVYLLIISIAVAIISATYFYFVSYPDTRYICVLSENKEETDKQLACRSGPLIFLKNDAIQKIVKNQFKNSNITSLDFSALGGLQSIEDGAFKSNNITVIKFTKTITEIGRFAFANNNIKSIRIPESIKTINESAFAGNPDLKMVCYESHLSPGQSFESAFPSSFWNQNKCGRSLCRCICDFAIDPESSACTTGEVVFGSFNDYDDDYDDDENSDDDKSAGNSLAQTYSFDKLNLAEKDIEMIDFDLRLQKTLEVIGKDAFRNNIIKAVQFHKLSKLREIGDNSFSGNKLTNIDLSQLSSLEKIGNSTFEDNHIKALNLSNFPKLSYIGDNAFSNNEIEHLILSDLPSLETFGSNVFAKQKPGLKSLKISGLSKLKKFPTRAFSNLQLTKIDLSNLLSFKFMGHFTFDSNEIDSFSYSNLPHFEQFGNYTFAYNKLKSLHLSGLKSLKTIGNNTFRNNSLTSVVIKELDKLETIGFETFKENPNLRRVELIDLENLIEVRGSSFGDYSNQVPLEIVMKSLKNLKQFHDKSFKQMKINSLDLSHFYEFKTVGESAFDGCSIKSLSILRSDKLSSFEKKCFANNDLEYLFLETTNTSSLEFIKAGAFQNNKIRVVKLKGLANLTRIYEDAFSNQKDGSLDEVIFHNLKSLTFIHPTAFDENPSISTVSLSVLPKLTSVGDKSFADRSIKSVSLQELQALKTIGVKAFFNNSISQLEVSPLPSLAILENNCFANNKLTYFPLASFENLREVKNSAFRNNDIASFEYATTKSKLQEIDVSSFENNKISSISLKDLSHLERIKSNAFSHNKISKIELRSLAKLNLLDKPFGCNPVSKAILFDLPELTELTALFGPSSEKGSFCAKVNLTDLEVSNLKKLKIIKEDAFKGQHIVNLKISGVPSLLRIGRNAFKGNKITTFSNIESFSLTSIGESAFEDNKINGVVKLKGRLASIEAGAFKKNNISSLDMSDLTQLEIIDKEAFAYNNISSIIFPKSSKLTTIGKMAFSHNNYLKIVVLPCGIERIEEKAFDSERLKSVCYPSECGSIFSIFDRRVGKPTYVDPNAFGSEKVDDILRPCPK